MGPPRLRGGRRGNGFPLLMLILAGCVLCGVAAASEESAAGKAATTGTAGAQGAVVAPGQARATTTGSASANESAVGGAEGISVGMPAGQEVAPGTSASVALPRASAAEVTGGGSRETMAGQDVRTETAPGGMRVDMAPSGPGEEMSTAALNHAESAGETAARAAGLAPAMMDAGSGPGESRVVNRAERSIGLHELREQRVQGEALSETSNVRVEEQVARMSPDRAWNVNQSDVMAVRKRTEEIRTSHSVASQTVRNGAEAIRARREVLAMSAPLRTEESVASGAAREIAVHTNVAESVSSVSTRVDVASGVTLVYVTAQNVSEEVVERPLVELALPKGMRYEALASAPPNTAVRVERTEAGEKVEMVLPFALFQREAVEIAVQTSPAPQVGAADVRARVGPLEEGLRIMPRGAAGRVTPVGSEGAAVSEHLDPRP